MSKNRVLKVGARTGQIIKYENLNDLHCVLYEEDFLSDETTMHCLPRLTDVNRDAFFRWCDDMDLIAEEIV